jgi:predicted nucleic acid-binding Zn ribbon protein
MVGGGAGLIFKGSGFYITDYKNKPAGGAEAKSAAKADSGKKPAAAAKSDSKS